MSLKKDKFKLSEKKIMNFAVKLAENNKYLTGTNPSVGCVIVKKNKILSFATTNYGVGHAENIALSKNDLIKEQHYTQHLNHVLIMEKHHHVQMQ